jgi:hypothetical protein
LTSIEETDDSEMLELDIIASFEQILASLMFECAGGAVHRKEGRRSRGLFSIAKREEILLTLKIQ